MTANKDVANLGGRSWRIWTLAILAVFACGLPAPSLTASASDTALVMGTVVDSLSQQPISLALVTLGGPRAPQNNNAVVTDSRGRFAFMDLPAGSYSIQVMKAGYSAGAYGRRRPGGPEQTLILAADEHIRDVRVLLWKSAAISGSVSDAAGEPVVDLSVRVLRRTIVAGRIQWGSAGTAKTDDRGFYRISSLTPGGYLVQVATAQAAAPSGGSTLLVYPPQYNPTGNARTDAQVIALESGEERRAVDLRMRPVAAYRITGTVTSPAGPISVGVSLWPEFSSRSADSNLAAAASVTSDGSGRFTFPPVPAGRYVIRALKAPPPAGLGAPTTGAATQPTLFASQPIVIEAANVSDVSLQMHEGLRISGRIEFAGEQRPPDSVIRQMRFVIEPADGQLMLQPALTRGPFNDDGTFKSNQLPPDRYLVRVAGIPAGWTLRTAMVSGRDVSEVPLQLDGDVDDAVITLANRSTELNGRIVGQSGKADAEASVLIFPTDEALWTDYGSTPRRLLSVRASPDGAFRAVGLPPGEYRIAAVPDEQAGDFPDPGFLKQVASMAMTVKLADGETRSLPLKTQTVRRR